MATRKNVPASTVRAWANENRDKVPAEAQASAFGTTETGPRGKLHPALIEAFRKANKGLTYEPKVAQSPTVEVKFKALDSLGRATTRKVTLTNAAARAVMGQPSNRRGRFNMGDLSLAVEAHVLAGLPLS